MLKHSLGSSVHSTEMKCHCDPMQQMDSYLGRTQCYSLWWLFLPTDLSNQRCTSITEEESNPENIFTKTSFLFSLWLYSITDLGILWTPPKICCRTQLLLTGYFRSLRPEIIIIGVISRFLSCGMAPCKQVQFCLSDRGYPVLMSAGRLGN